MAIYGHINSMNVQHVKKRDGWETKFTLRYDVEKADINAMYEIADMIRNTVDISEEEFLRLSREQLISMKPRQKKLLVTMEGKFEPKHNH